MQLDRAAVMRAAHAYFRAWRNLGAPKSFAQCLRVAWMQAKSARAQAQSPARRRRALADYPRAAWRAAA